MTGPPNDPYAVLGVGHDASQAQISSAYRAALRRHHPDTRDAGADAAAADTALAQTIAAYLVLADPGARAEHDRRHRRGAGRPVQVTVVRSEPDDSPHQPLLKVGPVRWQRNHG
jgi:curved DNA-binding protein CbpA